MTMAIQQRSRETPPPEVSTVTEIAETVRDEALALARQGFAGAPAGAGLRDLLGSPAFVNHMKYRLAIAVANVVAAHDTRVRAVYYIYNTAPDPDAVPDPNEPDDPLLHLLVEVTSPTAALEAFVAALDRALVHSLRQLPAPAPLAIGTFLDIVVMEEEAVRRGRGWAALLKSTFAPPVRLWERRP